MAKSTTRRIDNPLLQSTLKAPSRAVARAAPSATVEVKTGITTVRREVEKPQYFMSPDEETASVFEIISDLEKQLEAAFSINDTQEKEILNLKKQLDNSEEKAAGLGAKVGELKGALVSQKELSSELEFLENERLEAIEKIRSLEEVLEQKDAEGKKLEEKIESLNNDVETRDTRVEQIELELNSTNSTILNFQNQIYILEENNEELTEKLEIAQEEARNAVDEEDAARRELQKAKKSLDEIRLMLADTRAKARGHYYKKKSK